MLRGPVQWLSMYFATVERSISDVRENSSDTNTNIETYLKYWIEPPQSNVSSDLLVLVEKFPRSPNPTVWLFSGMLGVSQDCPENLGGPGHRDQISCNRFIAISIYCIFNTFTRFY